MGGFRRNPQGRRIFCRMPSLLGLDGPLQGRPRPRALACGKIRGVAATGHFVRDSYGFWRFGGMFLRDSRSCFPERRPGANAASIQEWWKKRKGLSLADSLSGRSLFTCQIAAVGARTPAPGQSPLARDVICIYNISLQKSIIKSAGSKIFQRRPIFATLASEYARQGQRLEDRAPPAGKGNGAHEGAGAGFSAG